MSLAAEPSQRRRSREGGRRRDGEGERGIRQLPWKQPKRLFQPMRLVSDDELEAMHLASLQVLEEIGMDVVLPEAREILGKAGALVDGERVRIGREIIEAVIGLAPAEFTFHARNPAHSIRIGGDWIAFSPVGGPPNCSDIERGRRPGTFADNQNFIRLSQFFNCIHASGGGSTEPSICTRVCAICISGEQRSACRTRCCSPHQRGASGCSTASRWRASPAASPWSR